MRLDKLHFLLALATLLAVALPAGLWTRASATRLTESLGKSSEVATASVSNQGYCNGALKQILRRVLTSCGLIQGGGSRGCQPLQARQVAAMSGGDFNSLFAPLSERAAIIQFDQDKADLDPAAMELLEKTFADQRGASYFLVVSRASPEGSAEHNRELSHHRGVAVLEHIKSKFNDPELEQEVGLLWLGEEFAQLDQEFCQWKHSRAEGACTTADLNRSAFIAWIDCRL
jgi:outer membrane protein OmpA-like peptidoglycan-associated protein